MTSERKSRVLSEAQPRQGMVHSFLTAPHHTRLRKPVELPNTPCSKSRLRLQNELRAYFCYSSIQGQTSSTLQLEQRSNSLLMAEWVLNSCHSSLQLWLLLRPYPRQWGYVQDSSPLRPQWPQGMRLSPFLYFTEQTPQYLFSFIWLGASL